MSCFTIVNAASRVALFAGAMLAVPSEPMAGPPQNRVTGAGTLVLPDAPRLQVTALGSAEEAKGHFKITYPDGTTVRGVVLCVAVSGNTAGVTGLITESSGPREGTFPEDFYIRIEVQDNGEPGTGEDEVNFHAGQANFPGCSAVDPDIPIVKGNFQVSG